MLFEGALAADPGPVEIVSQTVDLVEELAEGLDLGGESGMVGGGVEGSGVPGFPKQIGQPGMPQLRGHTAGDTEQMLGAAGGGGFEAEAPDFGGVVLVFDRETELAEIAGEGLGRGVASMTDVDEPGLVGEDGLVVPDELGHRPTEPRPQSGEHLPERGGAGVGVASWLQGWSAVFEADEEGAQAGLPFEDGLGGGGSGVGGGGAHGLSPRSWSVISSVPGWAISTIG